MNKLSAIIFVLFLIFLPAEIIGQTVEETLSVTQDSLFRTDTATVHETYLLAPQETLITTDTLVEATTGFTADTAVITQKFQPDAMKATWWGAIIPGFGQIMNRKYWKLPLVYGGFMGGAWAITFFSDRFNTYTIAYRDIRDPDPNKNSFLDLLPAGTEYNEARDKANIEAQLISNRDSWRRYRDLSIFATIAWYGIWILEAYVDAQLYDFDISPDLSLKIQPTVINNDICNVNQYGYQPPIIGKESAFGVQFSFTIK